MQAVNYPERLELLGLERLEERRITAHILFLYKLLFGLTVLQAGDFLIHVLEVITTNCFYHDVQLMFVSVFFYHRIVKIWNGTHTDYTSINFLLS